MKQKLKHFSVILLTLAATLLPYMAVPVHADAAKDGKSAETAFEISGQTTEEAWNNLSDAVGYNGRKRADGESQDKPTYFKLMTDCIVGSSDKLIEIGTSSTENGFRHVVLDLNGKKLDRGLSESTYKEKGYVIRVPKDSSLVITDSSENEEGVITGGNALVGGGVWVADGASLTLNGGTITANHAAMMGGGVYLSNGSSFILNGGSINGNTLLPGVNMSGNGGAGVCADKSVFVMNGGEVSGNISEIKNATSNGAGVCLFPESTFTMNGGSICNNGFKEGYYESYGGGVFVGWESTFELNDGLIEGNRSTNGSNECFGGGVHIDSSGSFTMNAGSIKDNEAKSGGGGVYTGINGSFSMTGGIISGNYAGGKRNLAGTSYIGNGGGVYLRDAEFSMSGGSITGNSCKHDPESGKGKGGGVYVYRSNVMPTKSVGIKLNGSPVIRDNIHFDNKNIEASDNLYRGDEHNRYIEITGELSVGADIWTDFYMDDDSDQVAVGIEGYTPTDLDAKAFSCDNRPTFGGKIIDNKILLVQLNMIKANDVTLNSDSADYTGSAIVPSITVTHNETLLTEGEDYYVLFIKDDKFVEEMKAPGDYTVVIFGTNDYGGRVEKPFKILDNVMLYSVTVDNGTGNGTFESGSKVTITAAAPAEGKVFDKWTSEDGVTFADPNSATTTFTMPAKNVTVKANFRNDNNVVSPAGGSTPDENSQPAKKGDTITDPDTKAVVMVTNDSAKNGTAEYVCPSDPNAKSVIVPDQVTKGGRTYIIITIRAEAFKDSEATTVIIGKNVKKISAEAFKGTKVRTIIVKSRKLTKKSVKNSLKGSKVKTIKVKVGKKKENRKYVKKYKRYFTKKNAGKKVSVK